MISEVQINPVQTELIKKLLSAPELQIFTQANWGSQDPAHRESLREFAQNFSHAFTSRSHTQGAGIFVAHFSAVGVDIEISERVTPAVVARIASAQELNAAPSPASLWSAKEAAFKALYTFAQPPVVSQISIGDWKNIDSRTETFRLMNYQDFAAPVNGSGIILTLPPFTFAFFTFAS
ncbi:4'-phosphopantetheinyl transferase superfamily protein [compost metagenome]